LPRVEVVRVAAPRTMWRITPARADVGPRIMVAQTVEAVVLPVARVTARPTVTSAVEPRAVVTLVGVPRTVSLAQVPRAATQAAVRRAVTSVAELRAVVIQARVCRTVSLARVPRVATQVVAVLRT